VADGVQEPTAAVGEAEPDQAARYDRIAAGYARWWAPVLVRDAETVLDLVAADVAAGARRIVDLGTGTGTLGIAAVERWPDVEVVGIDGSREMAAAAEAQADRRLMRSDRRRYGVRVAYADELPFEAGSFDLVVSSFVLQLVPSRHAALREVRRILRHGGRLAYVTWLTSDRAFPGDAAFDRALEEIGIGAREPDYRSGDLASPDAAARGLRRAGLKEARAHRAELTYRFDVEGFARFVEEFDEEDLVASLERRERIRLKRRFRDLLRQLPGDALLLRLPIVYATGRVPEDAGPS
jgi:ubiquinone/menaquinone biosynthesis C-methylase UbiE